MECPHKCKGSTTEIGKPKAYSQGTNNKPDKTGGAGCGEGRVHAAPAAFMAFLHDQQCSRPMPPQL